jgi:hypothetical protein
VIPLDRVSRDGGGGPTEPDLHDLDKRLTVLESIIQNALPNLATKTDIADVKTAIADSKNSLIQWLVGIAVVVALAALSYFKPSAPTALQPATQLQPIVIPVPSSTSTIPVPTAPIPPSSPATGLSK